MNTLNSLYDTLMSAQPPSSVIRAMKESGELSAIIPELVALVGVEQGRDYHPEGDVFEHSMLSLDYAVNRVLIGGQDRNDAMIIVFGALLHDIGKSHTTRVIDGKITAKSHDTIGAPIARDIITRLGGDDSIAQAIYIIVYTHMRGFGDFGDKGARKLHKLLTEHDTTIENWREVSLSDVNGRGEGARQGHGSPYDVFYRVRRVVAQERNKEFARQARRAHYAR